MPVGDRQIGWTAARADTPQQKASMSKPFCAPLVIGACLVAAFAAHAGAEETLIWTEKASDGFVSLQYGSLDPAKAPPFLLTCFEAMGVAVLDVRQEIEGAKKGEALTIALSAGNAKAEVKGEAASDDATGKIFAEASDIAVKPVLEVLRQAGPLTITTGKSSASLTDQGRSDAVDRFAKDCRLE
jgi:hypothetical protein